MKSKTRWVKALAMIWGACACCLVTINSRAASDDESPVAGDYAKQLRDAAAARAKDPTWKASHKEVGTIQVGDTKKPGALRNFCVNTDGNLLVCFAPTDKSAKANATGGIRVYSPKGELLQTWPLEIKPSAVCVTVGGAIFAAGDGKLLKLDASGKVIASVASPVASEPVVIGKDVEDMVKEMIKQSKQSYATELANMKANLEKRRSEVTGLTTTAEDVFMAVPAPNDFTYRVYRFDQSLENPKLVVEKLRGCCGQMDIQSHDGKLWIPHNARHSVECRDRDGTQLSKFGKAGRVKASDFGGCCEPKNMRVLPNGEILAAESGPPTCIKRFSASGKFIETVAVLDTKGDCVRVTVAVSPDGSRYYMLDTARDAIRIFGTKS
jgi:hypothetical protein